MKIKDFQHRGHREHRASEMRVDLFGVPRKQGFQKD
jgi:hypothetical protein